MRLAVIPARGGSKQIPRKNIKLFHGKPIIAYSIEAALNSGCFDKVIVSTDDQDIADTAKQFGAEVPFMRPDKLSDDFATTLDVIKHACDFYIEQNIAIEQVCCIYDTAPFIRSSDLQAGYALIKQPDVDYAFSVTTYAFPIQRALTLSNANTTNMLQPEHLNTRSQDLVETYHDAGQFYWGQASTFIEQKPIFLSNSKAVPLDRIRVQDIDTPGDWEIAESMYRYLQQI